MHKLIERQLRKATNSDGSVDVARLCELVGAAYDEADVRLRLSSNALDVLQVELETAYQRSRDEADARFAVVMDNVGEAVVIIDERGTIEGFNLAAERAFGFPANEVLGRNVTMLMTDADAAHHDETLRRHVQAQGKGALGKVREVVARRKDGEEFPIELAVGQVASAGHVRFIGIIRDITQRKQAERELRESEERFRDLAGSASDWFWETDAAYHLVFVSDRIASVLGVKPSAILGNSFFDIGLGDDDEALAWAHRETIRQREPFRDVVFHVGPEEGADSKVVRISGRPVFDDQGEFQGYRGIGVDVTRESAAERRAKLAQQQLADAVESMLDAIAVYDSDDRLVVSNSHYKTIFGDGVDYVRPGISFEEVLDVLLKQGAFDTGCVAPEEWARQRLELHREASGREFVVRLKTGRWILNREYRTRDGGVVGVRTDITEIKRRESELDALRRRYQLILDSAGEGIVGLDNRGKCTFANQTACGLLDLHPNILVGADFADTVQPGRNGRLGAAMTQVFREGNMAQAAGEPFLKAEGGSVHVDYLMAPMFEAGRVAGAVVVFRDAELRLRYEQGLADQQRELERLVAERTAELQREVDVRARTEAALRASRERLRGIADSLFEGVLVLDRSGQLIFANASARVLLGVEGDLEGHPIDGLVRIQSPDGLVDFTNSPWRPVVAGGNVFRDDDAVFVTGSGTAIPVAYACSPLKEEGGVRGAIISFRDIQSLKKAQRDALQSSRLATVGQLAAGIAHEINTPIQYVGDNLRFFGKSLTKLNTVLEAALKGGDPQVAEAAAVVKLPFLLKELPTALEESLDGVAQIARIVLSMKEFSHPGTNAKTMTDINRSIESTLTVSRNTWKHVAEVCKELDPDLPPVLCHAGEINQVFLNLIVNACHAIEGAGKPLPGTLSISTAKVGEYVEIRIGDSGTGIPESIIDSIFDPFFTTKAVGKGTGQGLAICRDVVVTKHGGQIEVDGRPGQGALFTLRLPIDGGVDDIENHNDQ